ncbi:M24 family metallopeptidase [Pectobacterium zantedeschiae]|uniref:Aminopeptidase P family protein n=1 Tax=Pectobacterium zantedeschiae TaxID=2034769 RepID=A0A9X8P740_9GAMM|nr:Xaa-Pro peptidase family protein [Pectobacterium zantedeschiae]RYC37573.1 aminopeptidase P family protein [Pectobacterium zantedeschiae]RYC46060.1 aminopeptidase P family protein [Pectobacterium zantedeschiae]
MAYDTAQIRDLFDREKIDLLIGSSRENLHYFTGFSPVVKTLNPYHGQCYALLHRYDLGTVSIVHSIGEIDQVLDADVPIQHVQPYGIFYREYGGQICLTEDETELLKLSNIELSQASPAEALEKLIRKIRDYGDINRIGFDEDGMPLQTLDYLKNNFPSIKWIGVSKAIRHARRRKTPNEVEMLTKSALINEAAIYETVNLVSRGSSETEIASWFNQALVKKGAFPSLTMLKVGRAAVGGQRRQNEKLCLESGDLLWFDSDAVYQGYWSDISRVYAIDRVEPFILKRYRALQNAMLSALDFIRPGQTGKQVFSHIMDVVHRSGFPEYRRHHVGHAIGLEPYELPILNPSDENIIQEGMVLSVETPYYEFGMGALHIEDPLFVGVSGNHFLTSNPAPNFKII